MALGGLRDHSTHLQVISGPWKEEEKGVGLLFTCLKDKHWEKM